MKKIKKIKLDKYDMLLEKVGYGIENSDTAEIDTDVDKDSLIDLMNELGIETSDDSDYNLILWNDEINDMLYVAIALYEICDLDNTAAMRIMLEAHTKGKSIAKSGSFDEMNNMKQALNKRGIEATVEN